MNPFMFICKWGRENSWCSLRCVCFAVLWLCPHTDTASPFLLPPRDLQGLEAPVFGTKISVLCQNEKSKQTKEQPSSFSQRLSHWGLPWVFLKFSTNLERVRVTEMLLTLLRKTQVQTLEQPHCDQPYGPCKILDAFTFIYYIEIRFFFKLQWMRTQDLFSFIFSSDQKVTDYSVSAHGEYIY